MSNHPLINKLHGHIPDDVSAQLTQTTFDDLTPLRLAHFLAQCDHESGGFKHVEENLNYSAKRIKEIFGSRIHQGEYDYYAYDDEKLANRAYADRLGNGNESSGDGWKYRGRGYIQITGKDNYNHAGFCLGRNFLENPDLVAQAYPLATAAWFFKYNDIWRVCDRGDTEQVVKEVTRRVNVGTIGLDDRIKLFNKYWRILNG
jgi:putative chitinase